MKILRIFAVVALVLSMTACATTLDKINAIVDDSVENADSLTEEDWALRNQQIEELLEEIQEDPDQLSEEDRQALDKALGRFYGEQMKQGFDVAKRSLEDFFDRLPSFVEGFLEGIGADMEE